MASFLIGLFVGFIVGGVMILLAHKGKVSKGYIPFIGKDGSLMWSESGRAAASESDLVVKMGDRIYTESDGTLLISPERYDGKIIAIIQSDMKKKVSPRPKPAPPETFMK